MALSKTGTLALLLALAAPAGADGIHKWVDAQGHVHFGDEASSKDGSATVTPSGGNFVKTEHPVTGSLPAPDKDKKKDGETADTPETPSQAPDGSGKKLPSDQQLAHPGQ